MGNCVVIPRSNRNIPSEHASPNRKLLRIVRVDGKVLEYRSPVVVGDLLLNFDGCKVSISQRSSRHLPRDYELRVGKVYYLLPSDDPTQHSENCDSKGAEEQPSSCRRIKVVLTRQQLQELLSKTLSVEEVVSGIQTRESQGVGYAARWRPQLDTIAEGSELIH